MRAVCIIPARAGSIRIPGKNCKEFHGSPIICYSINTAFLSGLFDMGVYVSTEDSVTANVAWSLGASVHVRRPALAENAVGTQAVMAAALKELFPDERNRPEAACCLYATSPLLTVGDLRRGWASYLSGIAAYAHSVGPDGQDAGNFYFGHTENFIAGLPLEGNSLPVSLPAERVQDINSLDDWIKAEHMYAALHKPKEETT